MNLPENIAAQLELLVEKHGIKNLKVAAERLSLNYRQAERDGSSLIGGRELAAAYAISRMPATYSAVYTALKYINELNPLEEIKSLLDVGAGTGAASIALRQYTELQSNVLIERDPDMLNLGRKFLDAKWINEDIRVGEYPRANMVISSYMLNEFRASDRIPQVKKLWQATEDMLVIVENGTPKGYEIIKEIRDFAKQEGICVVAPCPNSDKCPMEKDNWCHFTCRLARTKAHKLLKGGDAPYEDEKFSYVALSRKAVEPTSARVLRHPKIESGKITLELCTGRGVETAIKTKKDKSAFKAARKASAGQSFEY